MNTQRLLLLGLTVTATACPDNGPITTGLETGGQTSTGEGETTGEPPVDTTTGVPTTTSPTSTSDPTGDPTSGESTGGSSSGPTTATTGESTGDPSTSSSGTTTDGTTTDGTTSGTTTDGTTSGTTTDGTTSGTTTDGTTTDGTTTDGTTTDGTTTDGTTGGNLDDTIYEIQDGTIMTGAQVDVQAVIVTAISQSKSGFFAQEEPGGEFSGVWVFVGAMGPDISMLAVGDEVNITGVTAEFQGGLTEIDASGGTVSETGTSGVLLAPEVLPIDTFSDAILAEPWEGVHVAVEGAPLTVSALLPGEEFQVADGDVAVIDNLAYSVIQNPADFPTFQVDASFDAIAGPLNFSANTFKLVPRSKDDFTNYQPPANPKLGVEDLQAGDLVITEIMYNPTCSNDNCEWIEILNKAAQPVELFGLVIQDSQQNPNSQGKITTSAVVDPGGYAVLGFKDMMTWPYPNPPLAFYGAAPALNNGMTGDQVFLKNSTITIDSAVPYVGKTGDQGLSWKLDPTKTNAVDNDLLANWCWSTVLFFMTEKGSPGMANEMECTNLP